MNIETMFKNHVKEVYEQEARIDRYENLRREVIKDYNVASFRVKEDILSSRGELNIVNNSDFDLIQKQIWKIEEGFYDTYTHTQGSIVHYYLGDYP